MGSFTNEPLQYSDYSPQSTLQGEDPALMYSQPIHNRHHNAQPSDGRLIPYNSPMKATSRRHESDLIPSPYSLEYEGFYPDEAERPISCSSGKKDKWRRGDSPSLPLSPEYCYRSNTRPSPPLLSNSPLPRGKRRRSSSPPKPQSRRLISYDDLYQSRSRSPSRSSRTLDSHRPSKIYTCDNYGCGGQHSHDDCLSPMRCRGCRSSRHFWVNCSMICASCGYTGHTAAHCSEFFDGKDGRSRPLELSRYVLLLPIQACP